MKKIWSKVEKNIRRDSTSGRFEVFLTIHGELHQKTFLTLGAAQMQLQAWEALREEKEAKRKAGKGPPKSEFSAERERHNTNRNLLLRASWKPGILSAITEKSHLLSA